MNDGIFQINGPLWRFLSALFDMIVLHILWLICCIPVVTIGPATTAAHYVAMKKIVKDEGRNVWSLYFKSFRENFKQGMILGIIFTVIGLFLGLDFYLCLYKLEEGNMFNLVMFSALGFLAIVYLVMMIYLWAVLARFNNSMKQTVLNAFFIAMSNLRDTSILLASDILIAVVAVVSMAFIPQMAVLFTIFGVPLFFVVNSLRLADILDRYAYGKEDGDEAGEFGTEAAAGERSAQAGTEQETGETAVKANRTAEVRER